EVIVVGTGGEGEDLPARGYQPRHEGGKRRTYSPHATDFETAVGSAAADYQPTGPLLLRETERSHVCSARLQDNDITQPRGIQGGLEIGAARNLNRTPRGRGEFSIYVSARKVGKDRHGQRCDRGHGHCREQEGG